MADEQFKAFQKVSCLCGETIRVDPASPDRHVTCPSCDSTFDFVVSLDAMKKRSRVSIVLSRAAMKTEGESLGKTAPALASPPPPAPPPPPMAPAAAKAPPPKAPTKVKKPAGRTIRAIMGQCECGISFPVEDTGELTTIQSCPDCKRSYHVVFKLDAATKEKVAIIVPDKPLKRTLAVPKPAEPPPPPAPRPKTVKVNPNDVRTTDFFTPARKNRTRVVPTKVRPKPPPEIPPGAQGVPCPCGETFIVRRKDLGKELTCEGCGKASAFEEARDPQTLAPVIRIRKK